MNPKLPVLIKKGKLQFQPEGQNYISAQSDGWYLCVISKPKSSRTNQMNRYYWGVMIKMIAEETGYDDDQVHALMKQKFGVREFLDVVRDDEVSKSTAKYTVEEMQEYWRKITQWSVEFLNLQIPEPGEIDYE